MSIRLVATDIDGTLLNSDGHVSPRNRAALEAARDAGLVVAFVTGRPPRWIDDLIEETGHVGVAIGANGAVTYDMATEQLITAHTLPPELVLEIAGALRAEFPDMSFGLEFGLGFAAEPGYVHDWQINPMYDRRGVAIAAPPVGSLVDIATEPAVKLLAKDRGSDPDLLLAAATELVGERASITHSSSYGLLELAAYGVTKATGLAELAERHGLGPHQVAAIGDMPNDIPMLQWAGRSYAVANGHPTTKAVADEVTVSNDDDAVALLIESVLAQQ